MRIIRAGLTGCIAACVNKDAFIHEPLANVRMHKAVLRFRSDQISAITGIPFEKITVHKAIYSTNKMEYVGWSPSVANSYSMKVSGGVYDRSINNQSTVTRWLAPIDFHEQLLAILKDRIIWDSRLDLVKETEPVISTLPMYELAKIVGAKSPAEESFTNEIFVSTFELHNCNIHQTVYFPDFNTNIYRATLEGSRLIIESIEPVCAEECHYVTDAFGAGSTDIVELNYKQKIGKISPIAEKVRKDFIYNVTKNYNIYSLGRTATWRSILLDDCVQDIQRINEMNAKSSYDLALGRMFK